MNKLKPFIRKYLFDLIAVTYFQKFFRGLYRLSLWGMNIGLGGDVNDSGEYQIFKKFYQSCSPKSEIIVFDVGSNQGQFAQMVNQIANQNKEDKKVRIYCFEPSSATFEILSSNLKDCSSIILNNCGLGINNNKLTLFSDKAGSGKASIYQRKTTIDLKMTLTETINLRRLDDFCWDNGIEYIDYLKLDIEGHELEALKGGEKMLSGRRIGWIQFEFGGCNVDSRTYLRDFFELLYSNYNIYRLLRNGLIEISEYHETLELFTTTNFIGKSKSLT